MRTFTDKETKRIDAAIRLIKQWKKNIKFMEGRIAIQNKDNYKDWTQPKVNGYVRRDYVYSKKYYDVDIELEQIKIDKAKQILETI